MSRAVPIRYGDDEFFIRTPGPPKTSVLRSSVPQGEPVTYRDVEEALEHPAGSTPFKKLFSPGEKVTIIVPDITRYAGAEIYLTPVIAALNSAGVEDEDIVILFATGTHRGHSPDERAAIVGEDIARRIRLVDHDARGEDLLPSLAIVKGETVRLNRLALECDKLIVTGVVGFHYLAGFGGGRKAIMPGVASMEDARRFHLLSLNRDGPGRHPLARPGVIEGNPLHERAVAVAKAVRPVFALNTVVNSHGEAVDIVAGSLEASFEKCAELARKRAEACIEELADVVVASCGGRPRDINFIQAHKAYDNAVRASKPGGKIFLAARCVDGVGSPGFLPWLEYENRNELESELRKNFQINGQTALATLEKSEAHKTVLLSELAPETVEKMGMRPAPSPDEFIREAEEALASAEFGIVIPEGGYLTPVLVA